MKFEDIYSYIDKRKVVFHALGWFIFFLVIFIPLQIFNPVNFAVRISIGVIFPLILPVYLHFYLLDHCFDHRKYTAYAGWTILLVFASALFAQWFVEYMWYEEGMNINAYLDPIFVMIVTSGVRYYYKGVKLQLQLQEAQAKQYKAELDLLRFQVNPHFFFNTLNNLFAMARKQKDESTSKGIAKLSHLMRYLIYECNVEKIELQKEIDQINNFIELQKLRFSEDDDISINFKLNGDINDQKITPMLLIPFVENAFKHGVSIKNSSPIDIELTANDKKLLFTVKNNINKLRYDREDEYSGIGLQNVKRRLELLYPEKHNLAIENIDEKFAVNLEINL
jgi:two-component sensor histidine kinase